MAAGHPFCLCREPFLNYWLLKTEPGSYSWEQMLKDRRTTWSGITNALALIHLRKAARGDMGLFYHTGDERRIVGVVRIVKGPHPDPEKNDPKLAVVDVEVVGAVKTPVDLAALRKAPALEGWDLFRNSRLSFVPVTEKQWKAVEKLTGGVIAK